MPDCEVPGAAAELNGRRTGGAAGLDPEVLAVVERWNPQGSALLRAVPAEPVPKPAAPGGVTAVHTETVAAQPVPVTVIGPDDANTTLLRTELSRFEPRVALTDPVADPATLVAATDFGPGSGPPVALVLVDPGAAVGSALLDPVARLHAVGTRILFAMNGIHAHPDWRSVLERDTAMLARVLGAEPEILPVSARLAVAARGNGDAALLDRSGLAALHAQLSAAVGARVGPEQLAGVTARVLADTRARVLGQIEALRSGSAVAALRAERTAALAGRDGGRAQALAALRNRLQLARVDLTHEAGTRVRTLNATARADLDRLDRRSVRGYPDLLQGAVNQATAELDGVVRYRLAELARQIDAVAGSPAQPALAAPPAPPTDPAPRIGPDPERRHRGVEDRLMIALGASAGFGLGRLIVAPLSLVPALDYATVPVTLALGAGVAWWVVQARGHLADRAHLRQWVTDVLVNVKAQLEQRVATALVEAESELTDQVVRASTARMVEADRRVAELEAQLRRTAAEQPARVAACERDLAILAAAVAG
ncbi:hypothetical protein [Nocardia africana]|uniref:Uncharacterized protein n=1 Tax=Nocardia africana TaxID=134964 RepID=A0A378WHL0_9NOCA|nr:hypothetical protein [Nocardia africana]MCC3318050.1 hypothetical protein [Nocardia africana]SUA40776.1 Uncharacterised protein [Nocardia africana]